MEGDERFRTNLDSIFRVLLHEPFSIVDDTAIERLLNMLQHRCSTKRDKSFIQLCVAFWEDSLIWKHEITLSFALRYLSRSLVILFLQFSNKNYLIKQFNLLGYQLISFQCVTTY